VSARERERESSISRTNSRFDSHKDVDPADGCAATTTQGG
jgi:hypothetical protein